ncbi:MAG: hypothetical protein ABEJ83_02320 [Candidatus Nanohaloarchaea archaeon]
MEFREGHWANLVFVSTLGSKKDIDEIAEAWEIPRDELDEDSIRREARRLKQVRFFEEAEESFFAKTDSQAFRTEVKNYFEHDSERRVTRAEIELLTQIIRDQDIREKVFDIESVAQFYYRDAEAAKKDPLAVFEGLLLSLDHVLGHERRTGLEYQVDVFVDNMQRLETENPEMLEKI